MRWENEGWEEAVVIEEYGPDRTILKLSMKMAESKNVVDNKNSGSPIIETTKETTRTKIINAIKTDNYITVKEIAEKVGLRYHINKMHKEGKLEREGATKNGKWILH